MLRNISTANSRDENKICREIAAGGWDDPFGFLGPHINRRGEWVVRAFLPHIDHAELVDPDGRVVGVFEPRDGGCHVAHLRRGASLLAYRIRLYRQGRAAEIEDPYRFPPILSDLDVHLLAEGRHWRSYACLGAHPRRLEGVHGTAFAIWAPNAARVSLVGDFNGWDGRRHVMRLRHGCGVWEIFLPGVGPGALYKYEMKTRAGALLLKADPYAMAAELPPRTASIVAGLPAGESHPLAAQHRPEAPMSIYEAHLGSWRRHKDGAPLSYDDIADTLIPYVKDMGFTHIELLPIAEHPFGGSWGYQPTALYAPTARYGPPAAFKRFVNLCHEAGIGVIMDWVAAHFPTDDHSLARFDGSCLYEHEDPQRGRHPDWDTLIYNYGRREVANFLISNALFWLEEYGVDGLRVDAVASMLYLDYSREPGTWRPNRYGGRENLEALDFLRRLNETVYGRTGNKVMIAEESTDWPMVSRPAYVGGLGFGYKWNMGWMHDTLRYMSKAPVHRKYHHGDLSFGLLYAYAENFILPLSHDEVVHGKGSLLAKMPGDDWRKFANLRCYYAFMFTHPGKKLLFMGGEFGQWREWDHDRALDWPLLDQERHVGLQRLVRDLNHCYCGAPALYQRDHEQEGFEWIDCHDGNDSVLSYLRYGDDPDDFVVVLCNFTPVVRYGYRIGVPRGGVYREILNTDSHYYGGGDVGNGGAAVAQNISAHGRPWSLSLVLPPLAALILTPSRG